MQYSGIIKRFIPFVATFAVGLFVASFFISITPDLGSWKMRSGKQSKRFHELQRLREENMRLRAEIESLRNGYSTTVDTDIESLGEPLPPEPPRPMRRHDR